VRADQCASRCKQVIDVFDAEAKKIGGADFLAQGARQGTLHPDGIESVSFRRTEGLARTPKPG